MSGGFFEPDIITGSGLSGGQSQLLAQLTSLLSGGFQGFPAGAQTQLANQLLGLPQDAEAQFNAILEPGLRAFDREIAPRIKEGFAQGGASFSSRRGETISDALEGVISSAQSQFTSQNFPLQQTLGQIQGLGALFNPALGAATAITQPHAVGQESPFATTIGGLQAASSGFGALSGLKG